MSVLVVWVTVSLRAAIKRVEFNTNRAHLRIDNLHRGKQTRKTQRVDYDAGIDSGEGWDDDFHKTQHRESFPPPLPTIFRK
jgi:hypothetical protein